MITIKFTGKRFIIYSDLRIRCLDDCSDELLNHVKFFITSAYETMEKGPAYGFPVSNLANILSEKGIEVISYRDYEMENSKEDVVY